MMGIVIGLIVGVAAVVGVVMYFNRAATPFTNLKKMERLESSNAEDASAAQVLSPGTFLNEDNASAPGNGPVNAPPPPGQPAAPPAAQAPATAPAATSAAPRPQQPAATVKNNKDGQRFDFYKILPGQVDAVTSDGPSAAPAPAHADGGLSKKPYLQLGSFQNQDEADNLKAKLALAGIEATIQSVDVPGKGLVHRVRIGPFSRAEDADRVRAQLRQNGINVPVRSTN
jgi:hypothetical protein